MSSFFSSFLGVPAASTDPKKNDDASAAPHAEATPARTQRPSTPAATPKTPTTTATATPPTAGISIPAATSSSAVITTTTAGGVVEVREKDGKTVMVNEKGVVIPTPIVAERFRTKLCRTWERGKQCTYEGFCMFAHGPTEIRSAEQNVRDGLITNAAVHHYQKWLESFRTAGLPAPTGPPPAMGPQGMSAPPPAYSAAPSGNATPMPQSSAAPSPRGGHTPRSPSSISTPATDGLPPPPAYNAGSGAGGGAPPSPSLSASAAALHSAAQPPPPAYGAAPSAQSAMTFRGGKQQGGKAATMAPPGIVAPTHERRGSQSSCHDPYAASPTHPHDGDGFPQHPPQHAPPQHQHQHAPPPPPQYHAQGYHHGAAPPPPAYGHNGYDHHYQQQQYGGSAAGGGGYDYQPQMGASPYGAPTYGVDDEEPGRECHTSVICGAPARPQYDNSGAGLEPEDEEVVGCGPGQVVVPGHGQLPGEFDDGPSTAWAAGPAAELHPTHTHHYDPQYEMAGGDAPPGCPTIGSAFSSRNRHRSGAGGPPQPQPGCGPARPQYTQNGAAAGSGPSCSVVAGGRQYHAGMSLGPRGQAPPAPLPLKQQHSASGFYAGAGAPGPRGQGRKAPPRKAKPSSALANAFGGSME